MVPWLSLGRHPSRSTSYGALILPLAVAGRFWPPPAPAALDDPTIVAIFDAANTYDIEAGQLALKTSHTKAVRDLAQQFSNDHNAVRQQGRDLAKKLKVTPTPPRRTRWRRIT